MPILKATDPTPERPVIIFIYGDPGVGKTSLFNTAHEPLLLDFDRGKDRAILRKDTLVVNTWEDVLEEERAGTFKNYKTIGIDTAKAALDDFLMSYVGKKDIKNLKNKLAAYGAIGDDFKLFIANRRSEQADIVIIAHAKEEKDGDLLKKFPDVTGGSYQLLLRIADQVGFMTMRNNRRVVIFDPTDTSVGKNVARLPIIEVPGEGSPELPHFMHTIITKVRTSISALSDAQREALEKAGKLEEEIGKCETPDDLTLLVPVVNALPKVQSTALRQKIGERATQMKWTWDKEQSKFIEPAKAPEVATTAKATSGKKATATNQ